MVDSITPATDDVLRQRVVDETGIEDALPVGREPFSQWVIEDSFSGPRPAWDKVGVAFTNDVSLYENAKLRMLNGAHSALAYTGMLSGYETVAEAIADPDYQHFIRRLMVDEVIPSLTPPGELDLVDYCDSIIDRFLNPAIVYNLAQIAWDGSQKIRFRLFPTIEHNLRHDRSSARLITAVAAWMHFVVRTAAGDGEMTDPLKDELLALGARCSGHATEDVTQFLRHAGIVPSTLVDNSKFRMQLESAYGQLNEGMNFSQFG